MIQSREDLKRFLNYEKKLYTASNRKDHFLQVVTCMPDYQIWKYVKLLRNTEYHYNNRSGGGIKSIFHGIVYLILRRRKNKKGAKLGIEIWENTFDIGLRIHHGGDIVINGMSKVGKNCVLHGNNCIGNNGKTFDSPVIGDNVDIGVGAKIIGAVKIADNTVIGAGAVVVTSFENAGGVLVGIPAKDITIRK